MKLYRNAIILVIVLGLLVGGYVILKNSDSGSTSAPSTSTTDTTTKITVLQTNSDTISEIAVANKNGKFTFTKKGSSWNYAEAAKDFKFNTAMGDIYAESLSNIQAESIIEKNASNLAQYGLDKPVTVSIKTNSGVINVVEIGNMTPTKEGYYLKLKNSNMVYSVDPAISDYVILKPDDIRDTALFTSNSSDVVSISLQKKGEDSFTAKKSDDNTWNMISPVVGGIDSSNMSSILDGITGTAIVNFIDNKDIDLDSFGLKVPEYTLVVQTVKEKITLLIGFEDRQNALIFARLGDSNKIFTVDANNFTFLDKPMKELMQSLVYLQNITDVTNITLEMDGKTTNSSVNSDPNSKEDSFTLNGKSANAMDSDDSYIFKQYYQALIGVKFDDVSTKPKPAGKPEITITYTRKAGLGNVKLEYIPMDKDYYYVLKNGKDMNVVVLKKQFSDKGGIRDELNILKKSIK